MFFTWQMYKGFDHGLKRLGAMLVFTSSGVGTWGPPLRLGTRSEIVLIRFV
jgi:predicted MPP superfamily phosphohydrolase